MTPAPIPQRHMERWQQLLVLAIAALLLLLAVLVGSQAYRTVFRPPPLRFTQDIYLPTRNDICPGDTVTYRPRLIVTRVPSLIVVARTLWSTGDQRTIVPDRDPSFFVWTEQERGAPVTRVVAYRLPTGLPPGLYEIRGAATALNSDAAAYRVPFVIAESCFAKGRTS
ncbi:hypothetical protein IHN63_01875 [Deinococcus sp. 6YEL10]|uniref:hypothetical protein n=1 Tax=unclassified Deinococcus TaxID=2623546 RepID=UPI001E2EE86C|nr:MULTISPECIES: hypothetical protein [unclassified Deinococcus]MCD0160047.1 hypothetical protein [Deinococcus sp. 6YEL10]MCD0165182.1 hypothetical protein [Deinococcus sp. 12RED42]